MRGTRSGSRSTAAVAPIIDRAIAQAADQLGTAIRGAAESFAEHLLARSFLETAFDRRAPAPQAATVERAAPATASRTPKVRPPTRSTARRPRPANVQPAPRAEPPVVDQAPPQASAPVPVAPVVPAPFAEQAAPVQTRRAALKPAPEPRIALIEALRALGDAPIPVGLAHACRVQFGGIRAARRAVRLRTDRWSTATILDYLRTEPRSLPHDLSVAITEMFGTIEDAREAAGLPRVPSPPPGPTKQRSPRTRDEVLAALREIGDGRVPPSLLRRAQRMFGSFNAARVAAGLSEVPRRPGRPPLVGDRVVPRRHAPPPPSASLREAERAFGLAGLRDAIARLGRVPQPRELSPAVWSAIRAHCGGFRKAVAIVKSEPASR